MENPLANNLCLLPSLLHFPFKPCHHSNEICIVYDV